MTKKQRKPATLNLRKEKIRDLSEKQLADVAGGVLPTKTNDTQVCKLNH
jgi:hypothetical protein